MSDDNGEINDGSPLSVAEYAPCLAVVLSEEVRDGWISPRDLRSAALAALEILEREELIPAESPDVREVGESLSNLRQWIDAEREKCEHGYFRGATPEWIQGRQDTLEEVRDRLAASGEAPASPLADRLNSALKLQGVDLGPNAMEAALLALAAMEGAL